VKILWKTNLDANCTKIADLASYIGNEKIHVSSFESQAEEVVLDFSLIGYFL
jgi:hypothetical protein